ncbi:hypothetical protein K435DRAFT_805999 [Dendrothele bispora CBS 962.96]|uniref:Uncharacterized protein n=1 Tax=Dendrothele bispora (strain CBS 962.96) TaxID=1314807 RepID=A0A4S8L9X5_DENBC|nr:hypothetical protein K435DRAFT_805999 [Dendrothele bispora CBS 962.96]
MEIFSDELIHRILEFLVEDIPDYPKYTGLRQFLHITMHLEKDDTEKKIHRMRRIALPFLFQAIEITTEAVPFPDEEEEITQFKTIIARNADLAHLVRHVRFMITRGSFRDYKYNINKNYQFITAVLAAFPKLKCLMLLCTMPFPLGWDSQTPVIQAVNEHPSMDLCVVYPLNFTKSDDPPYHLPSISLSRVICMSSDPGPSKHAQMLVQRLGLRILHIQFTHNNWHRATYPSVLSITRGGYCSDPEYEDDIGSVEIFANFLDRHPSLRTATLAEGFPQDKALWNITLLDRIQPHTCVLGKTRARAILAPCNQNGTRTSRWQLDTVTFTSLAVDPFLGVSDLMAKLGNALPQVTDLSFGAVCRQDLEFDRHLFQNLPTKDIIVLLGTTFPKVERLHLSDTVCDNIIREWCTEDGNPSYEDVSNPSARRTFNDIQQLCEDFLWNLANVMPSLDFVSFRIWPNFAYYRKIRWHQQWRYRISEIVSAYIHRQQVNTGNTSQQVIEVVFDSPISDEARVQETW